MENLHNIRVKIHILSNITKEYYRHNFITKEIPTTTGTKTTKKTMAPSSSKKSNTNTAMQAMLQKGIDGYMKEKNPSANTGRETRSRTKRKDGAAAP